MNKRQAMIAAHRHAALVLRQHVVSASTGDGLADDDTENDKIAAAIHELADRHDAAVERMTATGSQP